MSDVYQRAVERISTLKREVADLEAFIRVYKSLDVAEPEPAQAKSAGAPVGETRKTIEAVRAIILAKHRPVPFGELVRELPSRGVVIPGKSPVNNLGARLSNAKGNEIVLLRGFGWWVKERPWPAAKYEPASESVPAGKGTPPAGNLASTTPN